MRPSLLLCVLILGCEPPQEKPAPPAPQPADDSALLGLTVAASIERLGLTLGEYCVIGEPPGIGRGVSGRDAKGEEVWLYVNRSEVGFAENVQAKLPLIKTLKVIGVARKTATGWITAGQVIFYYHQNNR